MKTGIGVFVGLWMALLLGSCSPMRWISVETYVPAILTMPPEVKTVMIVNNAAQQPDRMGHRIVLNNTKDSLVAFSVDSMAYRFCVELGKLIATSTVFDDVRMCEDTLRTDSVFFAKRIFTPEQVKRMYADYGVDALISLDNFFILSEAYQKMRYERAYGKAIRLDISGELRVFWSGQTEVQVIPFADSLFWYWSDYYDFDTMYATEVASDPDVYESIRILSEHIIEKLSTYFVPFWSAENRWYYTGITSAWKQGAAYAGKNQWDNAFKTWEPLYNSRLKWKQQAQMASNLALYYEMKGNFDKAGEYAEIAYKLMKEQIKDEKDSVLKLQQAYVGILKKRAENDVVLSKQLREQ